MRTLATPRAQLVPSEHLQGVRFKFQHYDETHCMYQGQLQQQRIYMLIHP